MAHTLSDSIRALALATGATMTAPGAGGDSGGGASTGGSGATGSGEGGSAGTSSGSQGDSGRSGEPQDVASLPEWARNLVSGLRSENASHRQAKGAAEQRATEMVEAAKVALGLSEAPTAEQLGQRLTDAQAETRRIQTELDVVRNASEHGGDASALLDSRSFLETAHGLDRAASDYRAKLGDAIKTAVAANSRLAAQAAGESSGQGADGSAATASGGARRPANDPSAGRGRQHGATSVRSGRDLYRERHSSAAPAASS